MTILRKFQRDRRMREQTPKVSYPEALLDDDEDEEGVNVHGDVLRKATVKPDEFWSALGEICAQAGGDWGDLVDKMWAFGPQSAGGCLLVDGRKGGPYNSYVQSSYPLALFLDRLPALYVSFKNRLIRGQAAEGLSRNKDRLFQDFENSVETGFQIATVRGPLCAEPMEGLAYFVEALDYDQENAESDNGMNVAILPSASVIINTHTTRSAQSRIAQVTGSLIGAVKEACRAAFLDWSPRLMLAMYTCDIQASGGSFSTSFHVDH